VAFVALSAGLHPAGMIYEIRKKKRLRGNNLFLG